MPTRPQTTPGRAAGNTIASSPSSRTTHGVAAAAADASHRTIDRPCVSASAACASLRATHKGT